jgi:non-ribosomal peptide synthetase component F
MSAPLPAAFEGDFERTGFESSIPDRFREILDKYPDRLAVKHHTGSWSYSDLDQAANRIANGLTRRRGTATETVGLMIEREGPAIAAILGVLKCGKIYVPLDRSHPPDRIAAIIKDCEIRTVITDTTHGPWSNALPSECSVIAERELSLNESGEFTHSRIAADALAAVFYTSGTTGRPKGVMQSHVNVLHRVMLYTKFAKISALDRFSLVTAPTYSASLPNLFGALLNGASIFPFSILDRGLTPLPSWLSREGITIYFSVPSVFRQWTALIVGEDLSALRVIVLAGEAVVARDVEIFKKHFSERCELVNLLASNETGFVRTSFGKPRSRLSR